MRSAEPNTLLADCPMPYCKGCGHGPVARAVATALQRTELPADKLCIVSDIGCVGLVDRLFPTIHTVHTTHGRSTAFATGLVVADRVIEGGGLKTVVMIGDGGATIGLLHLVAAAQLNVDITVVLHNNHLYGMTGGQASGFTPREWTTATTPVGNPLPPLDMIGLFGASGATFLARELAHDPALPDRLHEAISHPGFAVVEVLELCTAFGVKYNKVTGKKLKELAESSGASIGQHVDRADRQTYSDAYAARAAVMPAAEVVPTPVEVAASETKLSSPLKVVIAGTAGERVQSSVAQVASTAVGLGLHATQKSESLVTQGTGYSMAQMILSPDPINHTGIDRPDVVIATSADGLGQLVARGVLAGLTSESLFIADERLQGIPEVAASVKLLPLRKAGKKMAVSAALEWLLSEREVFDPALLG